MANAKNKLPYEDVDELSFQNPHPLEKKSLHNDNITIYCNVSSEDDNWGYMVLQDNDDGTWGSFLWEWDKRIEDYQRRSVKTPKTYMECVEHEVEVSLNYLVVPVRARTLKEWVFIVDLIESSEYKRDKDALYKIWGDHIPNEAHETWAGMSGNPMEFNFTTLEPEMDETGEHLIGEGWKDSNDEEDPEIPTDEEIEKFDTAAALDTISFHEIREEVWFHVKKELKPEQLEMGLSSEQIVGIYVDNPLSFDEADMFITVVKYPGVGTGYQVVSWLFKGWESRQCYEHKELKEYLEGLQVSYHIIFDKDATFDVIRSFESKEARDRAIDNENYQKWQANSVRHNRDRYTQDELADMRRLGCYHSERMCGADGYMDDWPGATMFGGSVTRYVDKNKENFVITFAGDDMSDKTIAEEVKERLDSGTEPEKLSFFEVILTKTDEIERVLPQKEGD